MTHPAQTLIDKINSVDINNLNDLLEFARFCKAFQGELESKQIHPYLNHRRTLDGKDQKEIMEIGVDEKMSFRVALITDYLQNNKEVDGDTLRVKIKEIDDKLYELLSVAPKNAIDGITLSGEVHAEVTGMMTAFEIAKFNEYKFPSVEDDPNLKPIGEYLQIERIKENTLNTLKEAMERVQFHITELGRIRDERPSRLFFSNKHKRAGHAVDVLNAFNSEIESAITDIKSPKATAESIESSCKNLSESAQTHILSTTLQQAPTMKRNIVERFFHWFKTKIDPTIQRLHVVNELDQQARKLESLAGTSISVDDKKALKDVKDALRDERQDAAIESNFNLGVRPGTPESRIKKALEGNIAALALYEKVEKIDASVAVGRQRY